MDLDKSHFFTTPKENKQSEPSQNQFFGSSIEKHSGKPSSKSSLKSTLRTAKT